VDLATRNFLLLKLAETLGVVAVIMLVGTSGRLIYRPVNFKYPLREGRVSVIVYVLILAIAFLLYQTGLKLDFLENLQTPLTRQFVLSLLSLGVAAAALYFRRQPLLSAGWGNRQNMRLGLIIGLILIFLTVFLQGKFMSIIRGFTKQDGILLLLMFGISLAEETIFRGFLQLRFNAWLGKPNGWLLTSALFIFWQIPRLLTAPTHFWINLGVLAVQSFLLGWIMQKSGHVLAPALYRAVSNWVTLIA
jgi:membrane protease YdiL (CAAX protease family)